MYGKFSTLTGRQRAIVAFTEKYERGGRASSWLHSIHSSLIVKGITKHSCIYIFHISQFQIAACFTLINVIKIFFQDEMS